MKRLVGTDVPSTVRTEKQALKLAKSVKGPVTVEYRDKDGNRRVAVSK